LKINPFIVPAIKFGQRKKCNEVRAVLLIPKRTHLLAKKIV
jgi:hypothetical protein